MSTALIERTESVVLPDLSGMTDEQLKDEFSSALQETADGLLRLAAATQELEKRGHDLSHLKLNLIGYLRLIAARQLLPEVVLYVGDKRQLVACMARLPVRQQQAILDKGTIDVMIDGEEQEIELRDIQMRHYSQVFGEKSVRTPAEQRAFVRQNRQRKAPKEPEQRRVKADAERNGIKIGNSFAAIGEVVEALAELAGPLEQLNVDDPRGETFTGRCTPKEKAKLKAAEKRRGLPEWHLVREALRAYGLI